MTEYTCDGIPDTPLGRYVGLIAHLYKKYAKERAARMVIGEGSTRPRTGYTKMTTDEKLALVEQWKASGLSKEKFAKKMGVSYSAFHKWSLGRGLTKLWRDEA